MPKQLKPVLVDPADLRRVRKEANLTQEALAEGMTDAGGGQVYRENVSTWERGKKGIGLLMLTRFADAVGVDFVYDGKAVVFTPRA